MTICFAASDCGVSLLACQRLLYQGHLLHKTLFYILFIVTNVRDVGVAGSNPVTPTIDSKVFFERTFLLGATFEHLWGLARG